MRLLKRIVLLLIAAGLVAAIVVASLPKPVEVDIAEVTRGPLTVTVDVDGQTRVQDRHVITAPLYGNLARIELDAGDDVKEGAVLARITPLDPPLIDPRAKSELEARVRVTQAARAQAEAAASRAAEQAKFADKELQRMASLARQGALTARELDQAELEARTAAKALESARFGVRVATYELEMSKAAAGRAQGSAEARAKGKAPSTEGFDIHAPVAGRVLRILRQSEGVVNPGEALLEIGDPTALEIVVDVLTADAVEIEPGDTVAIERWGGDATLHGRVRMVEPSAFTKISALGVEEQRVNVIIDISEPHVQWSGLGDGYRVETAITTWEGADVIKVPAGALHRHGDQWAVFVLEDGIVHERPVTTGRRSGLEVEVTEGLSAGETVIVHPGDRVADGVEAVPRG